MSAPGAGICPECDRGCGATVPKDDGEVWFLCRNCADALRDEDELPGATARAEADVRRRRVLDAARRYASLADIAADADAGVAHPGVADTAHQAAGAALAHLGDCARREHGRGAQPWTDADERVARAASALAELRAPERVASALVLAEAAGAYREAFRAHGRLLQDPDAGNAAIARATRRLDDAHEDLLECVRGGA